MFFYVLVLHCERAVSIYTFIDNTRQVDNSQRLESLGAVVELLGNSVVFFHGFADALDFANDLCGVLS